VMIVLGCASSTAAAVMEMYETLKGRKLPFIPPPRLSLSRSES
jgi:hypothetical protein